MDMGQEGMDVIKRQDELLIFHPPWCMNEGKREEQKGVKNRAFGFLAKWNLIYVK